MSDAVSKSDQEELVQDHTAPPATEGEIAPTITQNGSGKKATDVDNKEKTQGATTSDAEANVTKDGKPAEVGEKRERPEDNEGEAAVAEADKDVGKEAKKPKTDGAKATGAPEAAEPPAEDAAPTNGQAAAEKPAKRGPGRPPKGKPATTATAEGSEPKKRGPGRPRKGTNPSKEGEEAKGNDGETTGTRRSTRSRA